MKVDFMAKIATFCIKITFFFLGQNVSFSHRKDGFCSKQQQKDPACGGVFALVHK